MYGPASSYAPTHTRPPPFSESSSEGKLESGFDLRVGNLSVDARKALYGRDGRPPQLPHGNDSSWTTAKMENTPKCRRSTIQMLTKDKRQGRTRPTGYAYVKNSDRFDRRLFYRFVHFPKPNVSERKQRKRRRERK